MNFVENSHRWLKLKRTNLLRIDLVRFTLAGLVGFILTAITLRYLHGVLKLGILLSTLVSSEVGLLSNFYFHDTWTYKHVNHQHKSRPYKLLQFHMSSWSGVVLLTATETFMVNILAINYMLGLVIGTAITLFWNFFWTKYYIFKHHTPAVLHDIEGSVIDKN